MWEPRRVPNGVTRRSKMEASPEEQGNTTQDYSTAMLTSNHQHLFSLSYNRWKFWKRYKYDDQTERLYRRYVYKLEYTRMQCLLVLLLILSLSMGILNFVFVTRASVENIANIVLCVIFVLLIVFVNTRYSGRKHLTVISYGVIMICACFAALSLPINFERRPDVILTPCEGLWRICLIILLMYLFLPLQLYMTIAVGGTLTIVHLLVSVFVASHFSELLWRQVSLCSMAL